MIGYNFQLLLKPLVTKQQKLAQILLQDMKWQSVSRRFRSPIIKWSEVHWFEVHWFEGSLLLFTIGYLTKKTLLTFGTGDYLYTDIAVYFHVPPDKTKVGDSILTSICLFNCAHTHLLCKYIVFSNKFASKYVNLIIEITLYHIKMELSIYMYLLFSVAHIFCLKPRNSGTKAHWVHE